MLLVGDVRRSQWYFQTHQSDRDVSALRDVTADPSRDDDESTQPMSTVDVQPGGKAMTDDNTVLHLGSLVIIGNGMVGATW